MTRRQLFTTAIAFITSLIGWKARPSLADQYREFSEAASQSMRSQIIVKRLGPVRLASALIAESNLNRQLCEAIQKIKQREVESLARIEELRASIEAYRKRKPPDA